MTAQAGCGSAGPYRPVPVGRVDVVGRRRRRVSTVVVQRFCKPKVAGSNPAPGIFPPLEATEAPKFCIGNGNVRPPWEHWAGQVTQCQAAHSILPLAPGNFHDRSMCSQVKGLQGSMSHSQNVIVRGTRVFVALRKAGRTQSRQVPVFHAVTPNCRPALCAAEPGAGSSWAEPPSATVTCPMCLIRLARLPR